MYNRTSNNCGNMTHSIVNLFSVEHKENTILTKNKHNTLVEHNINKGVMIIDTTYDVKTILGKFHYSTTSSSYT